MPIFQFPLFYIYDVLLNVKLIKTQSVFLSQMSVFKFIINFIPGTRQYNLKITMGGTYLPSRMKLSLITRLPETTLYA